MVKSMTGYGRAVETVNGREFTVELRSVNNRYLDCNVKLPRSLTFAEEAVKQAVKGTISRGKVNTECEIGEERDAISDLTEHYFTDLHKQNTNATSVYTGAYINPRPGSLMGSHVRFLKGEKFISYP